MQIDVKEAARLLSVSERSVYRWVSKRGMPGYLVAGQYKFSRTDLMEWATARRMGIRPEIFTGPTERGEGPRSGNPRISLGIAESLEAGGIRLKVQAANREEVVSSIMSLIPITDQADRIVLRELILSRESLGYNGIGDRIAIPSVRNPIVCQVPGPSLSLCIFDTAVEVASIDGKPVTMLFTLASPTIRIHLHLLSRLTHALRQPVFREAVKKGQDCDSILAAARAADGAGDRAGESPASPGTGARR